MNCGNADNLITAGTFTGALTVDAGDGDDLVASGRGNDGLDGGDGNDFMQSGDGNDIPRGAGRRRRVARTSATNSRTAARAPTRVGVDRGGLGRLLLSMRT
jgi:Ca2+-binding RTX toxin-like protein